MSTISKRLDKFFDIITSAEFQDASGLGNELNFHVFDYPAADEPEVADFMFKLPKRVQKKDPSVQIQLFDLYEMMIQFFEQKNYMEKNFELEKKYGSANLYEKIQQVLRIATENDQLVQQIIQTLEPNSVIVITGVGKMAPLLRSHTLLSSLQPYLHDEPLVLVYPGLYENNTLKLFDCFEDNHYYRAFQLVER
ncbi:DUF1788 domain-containing protein [Listeria costaricensis]|uniref:DUF1788 domain-containing protein n=1 Tax=Listeria costaricensis TaxID=2026604 RepID=UPI0013C4D1B0|nr:DUF1788 domain-containing protein [Listeria costaricensis]